MSRVSDQKIIYEILGLTIDLIHLKINIYYVTRNNFAKDYQKDSCNIKKLMRKKLRK